MNTPNRNTYVQLADGDALRGRILDVNSFGQQITAVRKVHEGRQVVSAGHGLCVVQNKRAGDALFVYERRDIMLRPNSVILHK